MAKIEYVFDRDIFEESIRQISKKRAVVDLGSAVRFNKQLSKYKLLFKDTRYYALDIHFHPDLDIVADIQNLPLKDNCIEGIICKDVLYLIPEPWKAVEEICRILKKGGSVFVSLPFLYPYHPPKGQKDLYRFTKDGLEYMFRNFSEIKLQPVGSGYINTLLNFMTGFKLQNRFFMNMLEKILCILVKFCAKKPINRSHNAIGFNVLLRK